MQLSIEIKDDEGRVIFQGDEETARQLWRKLQEIFSEPQPYVPVPIPTPQPLPWSPIYYTQPCSSTCDCREEDVVGVCVS